MICRMGSAKRAHHLSACVRCGGHGASAPWPTLTIRALQSPHQAGVDQEPVEATGFRAVLAGVKQTLAAQHDLLLLLERGIEREPGGFLDTRRKIGSVDGIH